jgi:hypothetical protein
MPFRALFSRILSRCYIMTCERISRSASAITLALTAISRKQDIWSVTLLFPDPAVPGNSARPYRLDG